MMPCRTLLIATLLPGLIAGCSKKDSTASASDQKASSSAKPSEEKSQPSDTAFITAEDQQRAGIRTARVEQRSMPQTLSVNSQVQMDEQHTAHIGALTDGRITDIYVLPGANVRRGQVLAQLHGHAVHETVGALTQAFAAADRSRAAVTFAQQASNRYHHLYSIQAASLEETQQADQQLFQAQKDLRDAEANVHMEREHLSELLQVTPQSLTPTNLYDRELVPIKTVQDGTVITRNISRGAVVGLGTEAFVVSNLSTVWVIAAVNEKDLAAIHIGAAVKLTTQGFPEETFSGRVVMIGDTLDPQTRTLPVRIAVANPGIRLRPGMFATALISGPATRPALFVPQDALQEINGVQVVFVTKDGTHFRAQTIQRGTQSQGKVEIVQGLQSTDTIAVSGTFLIKSELLKGTMGED